MPQQVKKIVVPLIYFALSLGTLLVFWQVRNFDFVNYDDTAYVYENPRVLNGLTADNIVWAFTTSHATNWHPLAWLSLMLDCQMFGSAPAGFHLTNLFFHLLNTLLLFTILRKITGSLWPSAFVAALFAIHPMHVESVVWISERKDVLSTFFWLLAILTYARYTKKPAVLSFLSTFLIFALGLMAKPMLVTLPFVFLLLDYWPFQRKISSHLLIEKIPFFALSAVSCIITFWVQRTGGAVAGGYLSLNNRFANVFVSYVQYISKLFWPRNLAIFYPFNITGVPFPQIAFCVLLVLGISVFVIYLGRSQKYLILGWFWFLGTLVPVIGIIQVGRQAYADRYTYIPYIGLFIMLAWGIQQLFSKLPQRKIILGSLMIISLTTLGICAHRQTSYWKDSITLFSHTLDVTQDNYLAYYNLGSALDGLDRREEAIDAYKQTVKIRPDYSEAYYNLGLDYDSLGKLQEEIEAYESFIKLKPDDVGAYNNLGVAYGKSGRVADAIDAFKQVAKIKPDDTETHYNLGLAYLLIGDKNSAMAEYEILKTLDTQMAENFFNRINQ